MSLTTRLSAYFLAALALVLLGFSAVLFVLVRHHLLTQANQRLEAAMQTLVAAIEVHADDVEWEPLERHVTLGEDPGVDQVRWMVHDARGRLVDCSRNCVLASAQAPALDSRSTDDWRVLIRRIESGRFDPETIDGGLVEGIASEQLPPRAELPADRTHRGSALTIRAALPWQPVAASLRQLAWTLAGVSAGLWGLGILLSRCVCRRAIRPVLRMAASARTLRAEEAGQLLAVAATGDELEALGRAFNDVLLRLREVLERQQRFTGDASHQLRTPLTAVLGQVEVALRQERSPAEYQRVLELVRRRAGEMREIIELLLFLARMPAQSELPQMQLVNVPQWLEQRKRPWMEHPRFGDMQWPSLPQTVRWEIRTQSALLGQVLDNLLDNACKHSEAGTPITLHIEQALRGVVLSVSDRGPGIGADDLPHLCDPFFRTAEARHLGRPGVGLGLTVADRIVKALGGQLHIESRPGQGSRFRVYLPAVSDTFVRARLDSPELAVRDGEQIDASTADSVLQIAQDGGAVGDRTVAETFPAGRGLR